MEDMAEIMNYVNGQWTPAGGSATLAVVNPATQERLGEVRFSSPDDVAAATAAAQGALAGWRATPATERIQFLFALKQRMEENFEELARTITTECGKTLDEARGEMRRAIENVEVACGIPLMMLGDVSEDIAGGIDELMIRQPVGVCAIIAPFNFPGMIPFWFLPYAIACGNTVVVKPSERVPLTMQKVFAVLDGLGLPAGVVNLVNGGKEVVDVILDHPDVKAVSFVGSTTVAKYIYARGAQSGKRVQAQGGAKNPIIVLPDAEQEITTRIIADSAFGCAGQRCLAASVAITVGEAEGWFTEAIADAAATRQVGYGLDEGVQMGPVIHHASRERVEGLIGLGLQEGAEALVDGRRAAIKGYEGGSFVRPTVLRGVAKGSELARTEVFGPVLGLMQVRTIEDAIELVNSGQYGNMACLFTSSGAAARQFRNRAEAGNIGINIGVAAPMAFFPFSGWKDSFFGTLHGQGRHAVEFFTQTKVVVERWPQEWSRRF